MVLQWYQVRLAGVSNFLLGQMLAYAKEGNFEEVDKTLHEIDDKLWLVTDLNTVEDVEEFIHAAGFDIYAGL